ncbi:cell division protein FtsQ/DivIB [Cellulomonas sp. HZM]|uniref:cell division protein FtsQ/DivIB n=1 Tax=Cellulomonas sp. HZM TaxID=1454010 RepID=UPI00049387DC|nr:cell division protein FtsQ/DivIB [Cellulomonas sp. HZM]
MSPSRPPAPRPATPARRPAPSSRAATGSGEAAAAQGGPRTAQPGATGTPQPGATGTPQPGATRTPQPGATRTPQAGATPTPHTGATRTSQTGPTRNVSTYSASGRRLSGPTRPSVVSTTSLARFAERARARRVLARRQLLGIAGGLVALLALAWLLLLSPVLALDPDRVTITGAGSVVAVDQVEAVVDARAGVPLPRLDTIRIRDQILDVPGVREARVMRDWPHGVSVTLVAREPVAAVPDDGRFTLLDMDGVQVGRVDKAPSGLPVVDVPVGERRTLEAVLTVLQQLPDDLLGEVRSVAAQTQDTVTMTLRDGVRVDWGSSAQTPLKASVLATLLDSKAGKDVRVVDVSAPTLPVTR